MGSQNILNPDLWVEAFADEMFGYTLKKTSNKEVAEDIVQETFLSAFKAKDSFKGNSSERTWLFSILKFKIADYYRKSYTNKEISSSSFGNDENSFLESCFDENGVWNKSKEPQNWQLNTSNDLENKELKSVLSACIDKLPKKQQQLISLKLIEEENTETICKDLEISPTNYWVIIHRAKLQLRECLEKNWINT